MDIDRMLTCLGLGKNAGAVYTALSDARSPLLVSHIASAASIDRPEAYRSLSSLLEHRFAKKIALGKRTGYSAEDPRRIYAAFMKEAGHGKRLTEKMAQEMFAARPSNTEYFAGPEGIRAVFDDAIERTPRGETFYRYTSERDLAAVNRYLSPDYRARRDRKKLERLVISNPISGKAKRPRLERFIKFIPPQADLFDQNVIELVYADSVAFMNLNTEEAYIIRDADLAKFQAVIFKQLYRKLDQ